MANPKWNKENHETFKKSWSKLIAKAWSDPAFKEKLLKNPKGALKEQGVELPEGKEYKVIENTEKIVYLHFPDKPTTNLSESELKNVAAGTTPTFYDPTHASPGN